MNKKHIIIVGIILVVAIVAIVHWYYSDRSRFTTKPEFTGLSRTVTANDLMSKQDPANILRFNPAFRYLGGQKFILYGVADAEQHFFVETTQDDKLRSVYWIQYETYLPGETWTYDYEDSPLRLTLGNYEFYTDTDVFEFDPDPSIKRRQGTDGAMARQFLASNGYVYPHDSAYARIVYLTDESRQKELMIIFIDDLSSMGMSIKEIKNSGPDSPKWRGFEKAHLDRIRKTLSVLPLSSQK